jgi:hypothetical protein
VPKAKWRPSFRAESSCKDCVCLHKTKNSLRRPALRLCAMSLVHFPLRTPSWTRPRHRLLLRGWGEGPVCSCVVGNEKTDARRDRPCMKGISRAVSRPSLLLALRLAMVTRITGQQWLPTYEERRGWDLGVMSTMVGLCVVFVMV